MLQDLDLESYAEGAGKGEKDGREERVQELELVRSFWTAVNKVEEGTEWPMEMEMEREMKTMTGEGEKLKDGQDAGDGDAMGRARKTLAR